MVTWRQHYLAPRVTWCRALRTEMQDHHPPALIIIMDGHLMGNMASMYI